MNDGIEATIMFADIKDSTAFGYTSETEKYVELLTVFHEMGQGVIDDYCKKKNLSSNVWYRFEGDECLLIIHGIEGKEAAEHAINLAVLLKSAWEDHPYIKELRRSKTSAPVDLRIGIGSGPLRCAKDARGYTHFLGINISEAKRIESCAEEAPSTLIMVKADVKDYCERAGLPIRFGNGQYLRGKGIPKGREAWIYPVKSYREWAQIRQTVVLPKKDVLYFVDSAHAMFKSGTPEDAKPFLQPASELGPKVADVWNAWGIFYRSIHAYGDAIKSFQRAVELKPDYFEAWTHLGTVYDHKGVYDAAIECYQRALKLKPNYATAWNNLGVSYRLKGAYDDAIKSYKKALELKPDMPEAWYNLSRTYSLVKKVAEALESLKRAIELNPMYQVRAKTDECFNSIRDLEGFKKLVRLTEVERLLGGKLFYNLS